MWSRSARGRRDMAKRGPKSIGAEAMTPAERQRRRRARLAAAKPPKGRGRPSYDFLADPERLLLAYADDMIRRGRNVREAFAIAAVARVASPLILTIDGRPNVYVPPGAAKVKIRNRIVALRWKLEKARRDPVAAEWLRVIRNVFAMFHEEKVDAKRRDLMFNSIPHIVRQEANLIAEIRQRLNPVT
jgi:hypothetical protein